MFTLNGNKVTFTKGKKPVSIRFAQEEVHDAYIYLCQEGVARSAPLARTKAIAHFVTPETEKASVTCFHACQSAARAYVYLGNNLENKRMYSMNFFMPVSELKLLKDLPAELVDQVTAHGHVEVCFNAREV